MKIVGLFLISIIGLMACSKDEENGSVAITFKGINETLKSAKGLSATNVKITDFKLSFRDVEFKKDQSSLDSNAIQFKGPYDVDLMSETNALSQTIGNVNISDGTYKIIRFKLHKSKDRAITDPLYDRSLFIKGTINGTPFEFWHDASENFDIENVNGILVSGNNKVNIVVEFKIDQFLNSLYNIDLSLALDKNQNGLIEINSGNDDGNSDIADKLKDNIKEAANLIKL